MVHPTRSAASRRLASFVSNLGLAIAVGPAAAQAPPAQRVHFESVKNSATLEGTFSDRAQGDRDYIVKAAANHVMVVALTTSSPSIHFNVLASSDETLLASTSETSEPRWEGVLPADGDYTVRVYWAGTPPQKGSKSTYRIQITMPPVDPDSVAAAVRAAKGAGGNGSALAGTTWRLVAVQRRADGRQTPGDRAYTIAFGAAGKVDVRADCNRGRGTVTTGKGGSLTFGALSMTRAACEPGSLHDLFVGDLPLVRSYTIKGRTLVLNLIDDSGTYEFQRVGP
jgi:heat shock protein HslJ